MRRLFTGEAGLQEIRTTTGPELIITGSIQIMDEFMRAFVQVIRTGNGQRMYRHMFECGSQSFKNFELPDEIVGRILPELVLAETAD